MLFLISGAMFSSCGESHDESVSESKMNAEEIELYERYKSSVNGFVASTNSVDSITQNLLALMPLTAVLKSTYPDHSSLLELSLLNDSILYYGLIEDSLRIRIDSVILAIYREGFPEDGGIHMKKIISGIKDLEDGVDSYKGAVVSISDLTSRFDFLLIDMAGLSMDDDSTPIKFYNNNYFEDDAYSEGVVQI